MLGNKRRAGLPGGLTGLTAVTAQAGLITLTGQAGLTAGTRLTGAGLITLTGQAGLTAGTRLTGAGLTAGTRLSGTGLTAGTGLTGNGRRTEQIGKRRFVILTKLGSRMIHAQAVHQREQILIRQRPRRRDREGQPGLLGQLVRAIGGRARRADCLAHPATSPAAPAPTLN
jgi:hypothetical protein